MFLSGAVALGFILGCVLKDNPTRLIRARVLVVAFLLLASSLLIGYGTRAARVRGQTISVRSAFSTTFRHYAVGDIESYSVDFIRARRTPRGPAPHRSIRTAGAAVRNGG